MTARRAAERIHAMGAALVVVTGGHAGGPDAVDLVYDGRTFTEHRTPRIAGRAGARHRVRVRVGDGGLPGAWTHADRVRGARPAVCRRRALARAVAVGRGARVLVY